MASNSCGLWGTEPPTILSSPSIEMEPSQQYFTCSFLFGAASGIGTVRPEARASLASHPPYPTTPGVH